MYRRCICIGFQPIFFINWSILFLRASTNCRKKKQETDTRDSRTLRYDCIGTSRVQCRTSGGGDSVNLAMWKSNASFRQKEKTMHACPARRQLNLVQGIGMIHALLILDTFGSWNRPTAAWRQRMIANFVLRCHLYMRWSSCSFNAGAYC